MDTYVNGLMDFDTFNHLGDFSDEAKLMCVDAQMHSCRLKPVNKLNLNIRTTDVKAIELCLIRKAERHKICQQPACRRITIPLWTELDTNRRLQIVYY